jgi:PH (Pleckstrin Homology) domain-containing protein
MPDANDKPNVYPVSDLKFNLGFAGFWALIIAGLLMYVIFHPSEFNQSGKMLVLLVMLGIFGFWAYNISVTQLSVSADGLEYQNAFGTKTARWDEVVQIRQDIAGVRSGGYNTVLVLADNAVINVSQFGPLGPDDDLGRVLRIRLPRLFTSG